MEKNVLSVKNLSKIYSKYGTSTINALNNLNLEVKEGEIFGLRSKWCWKIYVHKHIGWHCYKDVW